MLFLLFLLFLFRRQRAREWIWIIRQSSPLCRASLSRVCAYKERRRLRTSRANSSSPESERILLLFRDSNSSAKFTRPSFLTPTATSSYWNVYIYIRTSAGWGNRVSFVNFVRSPPLPNFSKDSLSLSLVSVCQSVHGQVSLTFETKDTSFSLAPFFSFSFLCHHLTSLVRCILFGGILSRRYHHRRRRRRRRPKYVIEREEQRVLIISTAL